MPAYVVLMAALDRFPQVLRPLLPQRFRSDIPIVPVVRLSGVIGFYPWPTGPHRSGLPAPADEASRFGCPVLNIYGGADAGIPAEARDEFDRALEAGGVEHHTVVYEGAPHSFFDRKSEFAEANAAAWGEVLRFIGVSA